MTTDQMLLGVGPILSLAVGSQILASRLRIPALIVLLPVGFAAGALTEVVNPDQLLGPLFGPLVSLAVAVILFDSGLQLDLGELQGHTRRVVRRTIVIGVPIGWAIATVSAALLLGMAKQSAIMLAVILVVSGPTVVGPLLESVRPTERVQRALIMVAPYTGAEVLFGDPLTGPVINQRYQDGADIVTRPAKGAVPDGYDLLFLVRADGQLLAMTKDRRPAPEDGDTLVLLGPAAQATNASPTPSD
jgi:hypothetical protein